MNNKLFLLILFLATIFFTIFSLLFDKFQQFVAFLAMVIIVSVIFTVFYNFNQKLYLSTLTVVLLTVSAVIFILGQSYDLISIGTYMVLVIGALLFAVFYSYEMGKLSLTVESISLIWTSKFHESIDNLDKILKSWPEDYTALYLKSHVLGILGKRNEQLEILNRLTEKKSNKTMKINTLNLKAIVFLQLKEYGEAEKIMENILKEDPENENTLFNRGLMLSRLGYKQKSVKYYEDSLEIVDKKVLKYKKSKLKKIRCPENIWNIELTELLAKKGIVHGRLHQYSEALESFNEVLKINSKDSMAWNGKGYLLAKLGQYDEALKCIDSSLKLFPENAYALDSKGYALSGLGKPEEALKYFQKAIEIEPLDEERYYHKGKAYEKLGQYKDALECFDKVLELNPYCEPAKKSRKAILSSKS